MAAIRPGDIIDEDSLLSALSKSNSSEYTSWLNSLDVILVLGGGVPLAPLEPPVYVQRRCDVVAELLDMLGKNGNEAPMPNVLCLSAGTAHLPQYILPVDGLPLWESTSSAAYLMHHPKYPVGEERLFVETTSYDTISNAYFARTGYTDVAGWRKVLVVTNEFHIHRSKAIFDWIFGVASEQISDYEIYYLACNNIGLNPDAIEARRTHEARGETNVRNKLAKEYTKLQDVLLFLTTKHDFYTASKLVSRATASRGEKVRDELLELSYGKHATDHSRSLSTFGIKDGKLFVSVDVFVALAFLVVIIGVTLTLHNSKLARPHVHTN